MTAEVEFVEEVEPLSREDDSLLALLVVAATLNDEGRRDAVLDRWRNDPNGARSLLYLTAAMVHA